MADKPTNRQTVLLVDDESAITDALAPYLERSGFSVAVAHDLSLIHISEPTRPY